MGWLSQMDSSPSKLAVWWRCQTARNSVQPLEISTLVSVQMKSPPKWLPQRATVSPPVQAVSLVSLVPARVANLNQGFDHQGMPPENKVKER